jgi:acyl carrier protein
MEQRLHKIFAEIFKMDPSRVSDDLTPEEVQGWDSLGHLSLIEALEMSFNVHFEDGDLTEMDSVGKIKSLLRLRGAQG